MTSQWSVKINMANNKFDLDHSVVNKIIVVINYWQTKNESN